MKLEQLNINGYGTLCDLQLEFEPDITVIYGLNGSGKSTLMSFIRACIYGFYPRGSDRRYEPVFGGIHGGSLRAAVGNQCYLITRTHDRLSSGLLQIEDLLTGSKMPESYIDILIGGISQSVFETVFAFGLSDIVKLESLKDQELNALLYSVGLGTKVSLAEVDRKLTNEMDSIYKPRGRKPVLNSILTSMQSTKGKLREVSQVGREYHEITQQITDSNSRINHLRQEIQQVNQKLQKTNVMLEVFPHWQKLLIAEQQLDEIPLLTLPINGVEKAAEAREQLAELNEEYQGLLSHLPYDLTGKQSLVEDAALSAKHKSLAPAVTELEELIDKQKNQVNVAKERIDQIQFETDQMDSQIASVDNQLKSIVPETLKDTELAIRKQWILRIKELKEMSTQPVDQRTFSQVFLQVFAVLGWIVLIVQYFFSSQTTGIWITAALLAAIIINQVYNKVADESRKQKINQELTQLCAEFGISDLNEAAVWEERFADEESLLSRKKILTEKKEQLVYTIKGLEEKFNEKQNQLDYYIRQFDKLLLGNHLPDTWSISDVKAYLTVLERIPNIKRKQDRYQRELKSIYQACGTTDVDEISRLYELQFKRQQLQQDVINRETVLTTSLGSDLDSVKSMMRDMTKEALNNQQSILKTKLEQLQAELDESLNELGSLSTKKELLENDQKQEEYQLELELLKTKAEQLALRWSSLKTCQWVIEQISRKYEVEKQPQVLKIATVYFAKITKNQYIRVYAPLGLNELKVEDYQGRILSVNQLSRGTVEQLYLSLRFALAKNVAQLKTALPIIADDILVNFDHERLEQTVALIKEISAEQQIILLTCHKSTAAMFDQRSLRQLD